MGYVFFACANIILYVFKESRNVSGKTCDRIDEFRYENKDNQRNHAYNNQKRCQDTYGTPHFRPSFFISAVQRRKKDRFHLPHQNI